ncbi:MAG: AMP-binding protein [Rubrivivax sp.]|nr:AMP-binding protein [Rubrivivax sp.]
MVERLLPAIGRGSGDGLRAAARDAFNGAELLLAGHPDDDLAIESRGERLSYGLLRDRVARAAAVWRARGLQPGDRVAVQLPDGPDWVVAWLGALWAGGVAVGVNPRIPAPEWQFILEQAAFDVIVAESAAATPAPWRERVITLEQGRRAVAAAMPVAAQPRPAEAPAFWVHSSGTSGRPKAVVHAQRCLREVGRVSAERLGIGRGDRLYASSRLFFAYPLTNVLLGGLRHGATLILDDRWPDAAHVAAMVAATRPTVLFSVPSLWRDLLQGGCAGALAAQGLRLCVSAGEALPARLREAWRSASGLEMVDGYGASEVLSLVLTAREGDDGLQPSPGTTVEPLDAKAAAAGGPTRLLIRCATTALGYLDQPAAMADSFREGAFCPADLFVRSAGGGWRFAGREDALVKIRGRWVNLVELEQQLAADLPGLREAAAVCVPDADGVESVALFYAGDDDAQLRAALAARIAALPPHQRPTALHPIESLPRTPTGKLLRRRLQEWHRLPGAPELATAAPGGALTAATLGMTGTRLVHTERREHVLVATLDRAPVNALDDALLAALAAALDAAVADETVTVLHLRSAHRVFCAGADLALMRDSLASEAGTEAMLALVQRMQALHARLEAAPLVTLAEIGGAALGGGFELALACDLRIAADAARLGLPEAGLGLLPGAGGTQRLTRLVGSGLARRLILGAETLDGREAAALGLVQWSVPAAELPARAAAIATRLAGLPRHALAENKHCIELAAAGGGPGFAAEIEGTRRLYHDPETRRRVSAFLDHRAR